MDSHLNLNMAARLLEALGPSIVRGDYNDRTFPNEAESTQLFAVSRTVMREAIKSLTSKGLIEARPRVGTSVMPMANWNLLDADVMRWIVNATDNEAFLSLYSDLRKGIEPMAAGMAARSDSSAVVARIESAFTKLKAAEDQSNRTKAISSFHNEVVFASGNPLYRCLQISLVPALDRLSEKVARSGSTGIDQYAAVVNAVRARDIGRAELAMRWLLDDESRSFELKPLRVDTPTSSVA